MRLCRLCQERPCPPSREKTHDYRCKRCINATPSSQASLARYNASAARRAINKQHNQRRIMIGRDYHSSAPTADEAQRINQHIREKRLEFVQGQQDRKKAQSAPAR